MKIKWHVFAFSSILFSFILNVIANRVGMVYHILPYNHLEKYYLQYSYSLKPEEARQVLAHMMGVSKFHKLGFQGQATKVIDSIEMRSLWGLWEEKKNHMLITLAGVIDIKAFFTEQPLFIIKNSPSSEAYNHLMKRILNQFHELTGSPIERLYANIYGGGLFLVPPIMEIHDHIQHAPSLKLFEDKFGKEFTGIFDFQDKENRCFLSEILSLSSFINALSENFQASSVKLMAAHLTSLEILYHHYGADSQQYIYAVKAFSLVLNQISKELPNTTFTIILLSPTMILKDPLLRRAEIEDTFGNDSSAPALKELRSVLPHCYDTKASCENATNYCSNHGSCEKYLGQEKCYACRCFATVTNVAENGKKVSYWSGDSCQKKDISSEFQMFFWVIFFFLITVIWAIKLLYNVGNEKLSAVLMNMDVIKKT
ncbi:uncharacterized protein T551_03349 [Pneumocystis jirovecii RU7]|uniref:Uncharacterized protein n=1 Tax=Pneumocystis jirovecii (strain RU7) TaxID=1408657 RepID=A0A0W4ZES8_PNEJ7|nr:uncharacterized protein T551_03349 [Pneumocystis jirovecii RU7]KTW26887.1 hypothetical protein T551_03349 [Pneumocystis jirovecii RU7]